MCHRFVRAEGAVTWDRSYRHRELSGVFWLITSDVEPLNAIADGGPICIQFYLKYVTLLSTSRGQQTTTDGIFIFVRLASHPSGNKARGRVGRWKEIGREEGFPQKNPEEIVVWDRGEGILFCAKLSPLLHFFWRQPKLQNSTTKHKIPKVKY